MSLASRFLTLSIREQIFITIIILRVFSIIVILCLPCSFSYEILREDYIKKKKFFFNRYKEYLEACFYYQGYQLLKYEELLKRILKQADKYILRENIFRNKYEFKGEYSENYPVRDFDYNSTEEENENRTDILYFYCYNENKIICKAIKDSLIAKYDSLYSLIFSTDVYNRFRMPELDLPIVDKALSVNINGSFIFSFDKDIILNNNKKNFEREVQGIIDFISKKVEDTVRSKFFLYDRLYEKVEHEINTLAFRSDLENGDYNLEEEKVMILNYSKRVSGYYSSLQLDSGKSTLLSYNPDNDNYFYLELYLPPFFLFTILTSLSDELDIGFIPTYYYNNNLMFPEFCLFFMMEQSKDILTDEALNKLAQKVFKENANIKDCFLDPDNLEKQNIIKEIFEKVDAPFLDISNTIHQGMFKVDEKPFYFMKYSFPNLNLLKNFQSDYLILDQLNFYLIKTFKEPIHYSDHIWSQYQNLFYLIIILILYIWIICLIINMLIACKVVKQITDPIYKLQEAIKSNNIKDENVFIYEYDDIINELFITCKELLTRQIDSNDSMKYSNQFNILNTGNDKNNLVDKNKYEKNLIINKDIMNQLINEQQNMNDFSCNIDINNELDKDFEFNDNLDKMEMNENIINEELNEITENNKNIIIQNKISDDKKNESYKSLFRLAEYLYYYRCKNEENIITVNGTVPDETKNSNKSKVNKVKRKVEKRGSGIEPEENITINMLKDKDLTYMWYMEAKMKNNRSFNYQISDDYEELFMDFDEQ